MNERKNAIIGTAAGYSVEQIRNFVLSFREHNTVDRIILFTDTETKPHIEEFTKLHNVELVVFSCFRFVETYVNNSRFVAIYDYFANNESYHFKNILLADARDVIFQSDPFANLPDQFLYFCAEDAGISIEQNEYNKKWVQSVYGSEIYEQVRSRPIVCVGTVLGSIDLILNFLRFVYNQLLRVRYQNYNLFRTEMLDQAFGIYAAYFVYQDVATLKMNGDIVGTIGLSVVLASDPRIKDKVTLHMDKIMVNGQVPAIIHQYDRSPLLTDFINKKYLTDFTAKNV